MHQVDVADDLVPDLIAGGAVCATFVAAGKADDEVPPLLRTVMRQGRRPFVCAQFTQTRARNDFIPNGIVRLVARGGGVKDARAAEPVVPKEVRSAAALAFGGVLVEGCETVAGVLMEDGDGEAQQVGEPEAPEVPRKRDGGGARREAEEGEVVGTDVGTVLQTRFEDRGCVTLNGDVGDGALREVGNARASGLRKVCR